MFVLLGIMLVNFPIGRQMVFEVLDLVAMKEGVIVKSVTQDIDTSTATGGLQENFVHLINNYDNRGKSDRTKINTREVMLKGYWPYSTPLVYDNLKKKHRACFHEYVITDEGKELKKAFILKAENKSLPIVAFDPVPHALYKSRHFY